jgi:hypothetical protein
MVFTETRHYKLSRLNQKQHGLKKNNLMITTSAQLTKKASLVTIA